MSGMCDNLGQTIALSRQIADRDQIKHEMSLLCDRLYNNITAKVPGLRVVSKKEAIDVVHLFFDEELKRLENGTTF